jgi:hypothetical protein
MSVAQGFPQPARGKLNLRLATFVGVFALLLGAPLYIYLDSVISGGVKNYGDYFAVDLKAMSSFTFDQDIGRTEDVPEKWRKLDGQRIQLKGEIAPGGLTSRGVDGYMQLVYSVQKCCFSGPPQIQHFIQVTVPPTAPVNVEHEGEVEVLGKLRVDVVRDPETKKITGIYHLQAERVDSVPL